MNKLLNRLLNNIRYKVCLYQEDLPQLTIKKINKLLLLLITVLTIIFIQPKNSILASNKIDELTIEQKAEELY